jgi:hypothetical protein
MDSITENIHPETCKYNEICNRDNMCQDCAADKFESQRDDLTWEHFKIEHKIKLL